MKNLIKPFVAGAMLFVASSATADVLYWQVKDASQAFEEAWLVAENKSSGSTEYLMGVGSLEPNHTSTALTYTELGAYGNDEYLFYVEMSNYVGPGADDYQIVANGYKWGYHDLLSSGYIATGNFDSNAAATAASAASLSSVPEPSSGLLLLMGGALLALRRRRQK